MLAHRPDYSPCRPTPASGGGSACQRLALNDPTALSEGRLEADINEAFAHPLEAKQQCDQRQALFLAF